MRSLITLKALTYAPTGGIVAAPTTSLPEQIGGVRNWDYRFCWLRDATLHARRAAGRRLPRRGGGVARLAAARGRRRSRGPPDHVRRRRRAPAARVRARLAARLRGLAPVRIGNAASGQLQLDVYGEVIDALYSGPAARDAAGTRRHGRCSGVIIECLEDALAGAGRRASGRCAARGGTSCTRRSWPGSRSTARSRAIEELGLDGPVERFRQMRDEIHAEVCARASTPSATRSRSTTARRQLDASLLLIPLVGFLPADDPRVVGTVEADRARAHAGRLRAALHPDDQAGGRAAARRGRVPRVHLLAGRRRWR